MAAQRQDSARKGGEGEAQRAEEREDAGDRAGEGLDLLGRAAGGRLPSPGATQGLGGQRARPWPGGQVGGRFLTRTVGTAEELGATCVGDEVAERAAQAEGAPAVQVHVQLAAAQSALGAVVRAGAVRGQLVGAAKESETCTRMCQCHTRRAGTENTLKTDMRPNHWPRHCSAGPPSPPTPGTPHPARLLPTPTRTGRDPGSTGVPETTRGSRSSVGRGPRHGPPGRKAPTCTLTATAATELQTRGLGRDPQTHSRGEQCPPGRDPDYVR